MVLAPSEAFSHRVVSSRAPAALLTALASAVGITPSAQSPNAASGTDSPLPAMANPVPVTLSRGSRGAIIATMKALRRFLIAEGPTVLAVASRLQLSMDIIVGRVLAIANAQGQQDVPATPSAEPDNRSGLKRLGSNASAGRGTSSRGQRRSATPSSPSKALGVATGSVGMDDEVTAELSKCGRSLMRAVAFADEAREKLEQGEHGNAAASHEPQSKPEQ